jgi:hypothetical protein
MGRGEEKRRERRRGWWSNECGGIDERGWTGKKEGRTGMKRRKDTGRGNEVAKKMLKSKKNRSIDKGKSEGKIK